MSLFDNILSKLQSNSQNHESGYLNCIPFAGMDRMEHYVPGIEQSTYYCVTSNSGTGKSKYVRSFFIGGPLQYVKNNPHLGITLKIFIFSLEESREKVILTQVSKYLYDNHGISIGIKELQSIGKHNRASKEVLELVSQAKDTIEGFLKDVEIITKTRNPEGMWHVLKSYAYTVGDYYDKHGNKIDARLLSVKGNTEYTKIDEYRLRNERHYTIAIYDHVGLITPEKGYTLHGAISKLSSQHNIKLRDTFKMSLVAVHQQAADKEKQQFTSSGKSIEEKLEPSMDGLGDNKLVQRDYDIVFGLFAPARYGIDEHQGYNVKFLRDNYRSLIVLKDRNGTSNLRVPLFFNGAVGLFKEMPKLDNLEGMRAVTNTVNRLRNK